MTFGQFFVAVIGVSFAFVLSDMALVYFRTRYPRNGGKFSIPAVDELRRVNQRIYSGGWLPGEADQELLYETYRKMVTEK